VLQLEEVMEEKERRRRIGRRRRGYRPPNLLVHKKALMLYC